ncbi:unknown [Clostridium sp. CAG:510]|nr:unknown [Clostridium sp. CAG:510]
MDKTVYLTLIFRGYVIIVEVKIGRLIFSVFFTEGIGKHGFELTFYL